MGTQHSLTAISLEMERQKRDAQSRQEQDRVGGPPSEPETQPCLEEPVRGGGMALPLGSPRRCGKLQPFPGSPHLREVARLCPREPLV